METGKDYFAPLKRVLSTYLDSDEIEAVEGAYHFAKKAHAHQVRISGEPYITHPVAAATILAEFQLDCQSIMATILHDVLEDTAITKRELQAEFGEEITELVDGVSKLTQIDFKNRQEAQAENFRKMVLAMVRDIRVILVKLADRLHNMRTIYVMPHEKRRIKAMETLEIYAPIANRLGMHGFYVELEDLGFKALHPLRYRILKAAVKKARGNRIEIMHVIEAGLRKVLNERHIPITDLFGRQKHLYSIYKKMRNKQASFVEIMDIYAFRIVVENDDNVYRVLGAIHGLYKPLQERFKDYIAIPKANGYQALHTTLFGPYGVPIEVQIRTQEMDQVAENGIAAHWLYKSAGLDADATQNRAQAWVKGLLEIQQSTGSSLEFIENVKIDLFPDEVYVFTPEGDIMELPKGATPVDFAYMVHSDIGNSCVAAKVNRRLAPLSMPLSNGQTVEVVTAPGASPNPAWLNFVVTGKARSNIRHFLKSQKQSESLSLGQRLLEKALRHYGQTAASLSEETKIAFLAETEFQGWDDVLVAIGLGNALALLVARRLMNEVSTQKQQPDSEDMEKVPPLMIKGTEGMVLQFAECCRPIPGDPIVGCLSAGQGIIVHVEDCAVVEKWRHDPTHFIHMCWQDEVVRDFKVDLYIGVVNRRGVLALLAGAIADAEANIDNIVVDPRDGRFNDVKFTLTVRDRVHLARVIRRIRRDRGVLKISRKPIMR